MVRPAGAPPSRAGPVRATAGALPAHRPATRLPQYLLLGATLVAFLISVGAFLGPQVAAILPRSGPAGATGASAPAAPATSPAAPALTPAELDEALSYARQMRADDTLVQVRPGVFAKRSNVEGVRLNGRTVYYDVLPHQSFGPLRSGKVSESQITVLGTERLGDTLVIVYALK
jgi:hypothetical protein